MNKRENILYDFDGEMYANSGCEDFEDKDHINRQQAENERLQKLLDNKCDRCIANERAEAVRECIEKIKSKAAKCVMTDNGIPVAGSASYSISEVELYKIEKEMVGAESGSIL